MPPHTHPGPAPPPAGAPQPQRRPTPARLLRLAAVSARTLAWAVALAWATLAIWYSNLPWPPARALLAAAFLALGIWAAWISRRRWAFPAAATALAAVILWWLSIPPSHDRPWRPEVAVMPRATIDGDLVRITNLRNFEYRGRDDFTPRYETREYLLSRLRTLDFYISYWRPGPVAHTFVSFGFEDAPPLCISIETRPELGEGFSPIGSMFKQFELIYVVGDERDVVGVRTHHRGEEVYLYRIRTSPEAARRLLLVYLDRINRLADRPEWYHLLKNNCTLNIVRYANRAGRPGGFDPRYLVNGFADRALYREGYLAADLPFAEARRRARINDAALASDPASPTFWRDIRAHLEDHPGPANP